MLRARGVTVLLVLLCTSCGDRESKVYPDDTSLGALKGFMDAWEEARIEDMLAVVASPGGGGASPATDETQRLKRLVQQTELLSYQMDGSEWKESAPDVHQYTVDLEVKPVDGAGERKLKWEPILRLQADAPGGPVWRIDPKNLISVLEQAR